MVSKKAALKAKTGRAAARETVRPKSVVKKGLPPTARKLAGKVGRTEVAPAPATKAVIGRAGISIAKPGVPAVGPAVVPARGRPGRKPKQSEEQLIGAEASTDAVPEAGDDVADPGVQIVEKMSATKLRAKDRRAKEKALKEALERSYHGTEEDLEARRNKLKALIKLGKERGFLTYAEINDHLPDNLVDAEAIDSIISTFGDMGIRVFDQAPDAETLLMNENVPAATTDDDVEEEPEAPLPTVDGEFGRTPDPVRMYMREMGSVELLTREGEIEIAKRIEEGLRHMIQAISACPMTVAQILDLSDRIARDELKIDDLVDGLMDFNEELTTMQDVDTDSEVEEDDEADAGAIASENLERLKV